MKTIFFITLLIPFLSYSASLTLSGNPPPLKIEKATAGFQPESCKESSTSYSIQVNPHQKISILAALASPMDPHTSLKISLTAPSFAESFPLSLQTKAQPVVINILEGKHENLSISYEYEALVKAGIIQLSQKTIIFTLLETSNH